MRKYTIHGVGESVSETAVELDDQERAIVLRIFDAVNKTAEANDDYSPMFFLFETDDELPINDTYWPTPPWWSAQTVYTRSKH